MATVNSHVRRNDGSDGWDVLINDCGLLIQVDFALTLITTDGFAFRIEQPLVFTDQHDDDHLLTPEEDPTRLAPVLALARTSMKSASALDDGRLELDFQDGSRICVSRNDDFEPWQACGPGGLKLVASAGGELAIWV